jgi:hypothetical protein
MANDDQRRLRNAITIYARPESLAGTAWLAERIADPGLRVIYGGNSNLFVAYACW